MKETVHDVGRLLILESQLRAGNVSWLTLEPYQDFQVGEHQLAIFTGSLCSEKAVFDAWLVMGGGNSGFYNRENYPVVQDAVAQHLGRLALEGKVEIVETTDVTARIKAKGTNS